MTGHTDLLLGLFIFVIFLIAAAIMFTRKMPALLVLPLMGLAIVGGAAAIKGQISFGADILGGVIPQGAFRLHEAIITAFFGGMLSFIMQKTGVAQSMVKQAAELIGDNPLGVAMFSMTFIAILFTSIGGLGAIIMVAMVFLPMLATVGVPPVVAGAILLIGVSIGGSLNPGNWVLYSSTLGADLADVKLFALLSLALLYLTGTVFICVELYRAGAVKSFTQVGVTLVAAVLICSGFLYTLYKSGGAPAASDPVVAVFTESGFKYAELPGSDVRYLPKKDGSATFVLPDAAQGEVVLVRVNRDGKFSGDADFRKLLPADLRPYRTLTLKASSSVPVKLRVKLLPADEKAPVIERSLAGMETKSFPLFVGDFKAGAVEGLEISAVLPTVEAGASPNATPMLVTLYPPAFALEKVVPGWRKVLQWLFALVGAVILVLTLADIWSRLKRWRQQIVRIHWYSYLIPLVPLVLILVYEVNIVAAFLVGFVFAVLVTLRPGSMSITIQCMIQGAASVLPAALLIVGIGILLTSILGPNGWSDANGGAVWPVKAAIEPVLKAVAPHNAFSYVLLFGLCAPLALYRGPLNQWGLGFGVASILVAAQVPGAAVVAMLMMVGQVQGVCDPTNTQNVWLANELRVDVQGFLWRTLPYIWIMAVVGLIVSSFFITWPDLTATGVHQ